MNTKPNIPEDMRSWAKAGGQWLMLLFLTDAPGAYLIFHHQSWPLIVRIIISLIPLAVALLYVRAIVKWVRGMDELHRQITLSAYAFATVAYLALSGMWSLLADRAGIMENVFHLSRLGTLERMPFTNLTFTACMIYLLFGIAYTHVFNRRYK